MAHDPRLPNLTGSNANVILMDSSIRHAVFTERFKTMAWKRVVAFLNSEVYPDLLGKLTTRLERIRLRGFDTNVLRTQQYRDMLTAVDEIISGGLINARNLSTIEDLIPLARREALFITGELASAVPAGLDLSFTSPGAATLNSVVTARPFNGKLLRDHYRKLDIDTRAALRSQINIGITTGESTEEIVRRVRGTKANNFTDGVLQTTRRQATVITRTAVNHVVTHAREATYDTNSEFIKGVRYVATLDNRTTFICASLDGKVFPINEGERPPVHMQCRSTTTPVLKSWKELGIDLKEAPPGTRASMNGQVPATETYTTWLRRQPRSVQRDILGPARLKAFDDGTVTSMGDLLGPTGQPLTLDQLFRRSTG